MKDQNPGSGYVADGDGLYTLIEGRHGRFLANRNDIYIGRALIEYGEFSELEASLISNLLPEHGTVIEVGANIGALTVAIARKVGPKGRVHAFEPQPIIFQNLCANLALNDLQNVSAYNKACGVHRGSFAFPAVDYTVEGNFGGIEISPLLQNVEGHSVLIEPIDDLKLPQLDLLKIDAEGMETEILEGAANCITEFRPILYVENDRIEKSYALITLIQNHGYRLWWHFPPLYNPENWANNIYNPWPRMVSFNMLCIHRSRPANVKGFQKINDPNDHPMRGKKS